GVRGWSRRARAGRSAQQERPAGRSAVRRRRRPHRACLPRLVRDGRRHRGAQARSVRVVSTNRSCDIRRRRWAGRVSRLQAASDRAPVPRAADGSRFPDRRRSARRRNARRCAESGRRPGRRRSGGRRRDDGILVTGLLGGTFNPPHNGHVALAQAAKERFGFDEFVVLVAVRPGHKRVELDPETRIELVRAAFPDDVVKRDEDERTVDTLRRRHWDDPLFVIGADEFCDFLTWKDPEGVLERARLAVATRPGYPRDRLDSVLARLSRPERVLFFEIEPLPISSRDVRERVARGEEVSGFVPPAVARLISERGLYRGYTGGEERT